MFIFWNVSGKSASLRRGAPERWHPRQEALPWEEAQPSLKRGLLRYPANQGRPFPITGCIGQPPIKVICDAVSFDRRQARSQYWAYIHWSILGWTILRFVILCMCNTKVGNTVDCNTVQPFPFIATRPLLSLWSQYWALLGLPLLCLFV